MLHLFLHLRLGIFRACLNVALKSHRSQLYLIPHVSIASALSNDIFVAFVLTFNKVIFVPECFDCLWYLKACLVAALKSHLSKLKLIPSCFYCLWSLRLPLCFALCSHWSQSIIIPSCFDCLCTLRWHFCVALFSHWSQLDLISTCFDSLWILRLILLYFQRALLCSFMFHVSIECALSYFFWFLLCTNIDHNQIWCLRA